MYIGRRYYAQKEEDERGTAAEAAAAEQCKSEVILAYIHTHTHIDEHTYIYTMITKYFYKRTKVYSLFIYVLYTLLMYIYVIYINGYMYNVHLERCDEEKNFVCV